MNPNNKLILLVAVFALFAFNAPAMASQANGNHALMATKKFPGAGGSAVVTDTHINIDATGLKPNSVYTVWFVNMKPKKQETGAGDPPFMFKTDANGNGTYTASLKESPYGKWSMLMVVERPNGNPMDMKHMIGALSTALE